MAYMESVEHYSENAMKVVCRRCYSQQYIELHNWTAICWLQNTLSKFTVWRTATSPPRSSTGLPTLNQVLSILQFPSLYQLRHSHDLVYGIFVPQVQCCCSCFADNILKQHGYFNCFLEDNTAIYAVSSTLHKQAVTVLYKHILLSCYSAFW